MPHADEEKRKQYQREYSKKNRERKKRYNEENKEKLKNKRKERESTQEFKDKKNEYNRQRYPQKREELLEKRRAYYQKIKAELNSKRRARYSTDATQRIKAAMSAGVRESLLFTETKKDNREWEVILGYTRYDLMAHLESLFKDGMTWDNYGSYWHIDHIKPQSLFVFESMHDPAFKECWALENLQPLEAFLNQSKGNRFVG